MNIEDININTVVTKDNPQYGVVCLGNDPETGQPVYYESYEANLNILASIARILIPILVSAGLKALIEFISKGDFSLKYPGGKLKLGYSLSAIDQDNLLESSKKSNYLGNFTIENEFE